MAAAGTKQPADTETETETPPPEPPGKNRRRRLLFLAIPVLVAGGGAGLWFGGPLPRWLGLRKPRPAAANDANPAMPVVHSLELPEIIANLNSGPGQNAAFIKLQAVVELASARDVAIARAGLPRLLDLFQTYLREMRPEELAGSAGTWRLREELIARANVAIAPARVTDVLFTELLVQ